MIMLDKVTGRLCRVYEARGGGLHNAYRLVVLGTGSQVPEVPTKPTNVQASWRRLDQLAYVKLSDLKAVQEQEAHNADQDQSRGDNPQP